MHLENERPLNKSKNTFSLHLEHADPIQVSLLFVVVLLFKIVLINDYKKMLALSLYNV